VTWSLRDALAPTVVTHHAAITDPARVGKLLLAIDNCTGNPETRCALKLAPLVMLRPFELRFGEWQEVDFEKVEWRIPPERMKMSSPHIVPLSKQSITILCDLHEVTGSERYLFPVLGTDEGVMSENTIN
jgi:integrase